MHNHELIRKTSANNFKARKGDQNKSVWLGIEKTKPFMNLVRIMQKELGTIEKAFELIGICGSTQKGLYHGSITYETAQKILTAYKKMKAHEIAKS